MTSPSFDGYHAGIRGDDPRLCPYAKMTREWREWQMWHGWGVAIKAGAEGHSTPELRKPVEKERANERYD